MSMDNSNYNILCNGSTEDVLQILYNEELTQQDLEAALLNAFHMISSLQYRIKVLEAK